MSRVARRLGTPPPPPPDAGVPPGTPDAAMPPGEQPDAPPGGMNEGGTGGCGCRAGEPTNGAAAWLALALILFLTRRRSS